MTQLPTISDLARYAATPGTAPSGWLPLRDVMSPLDHVVERFMESTGHQHALFRITGVQPNVLILRQRGDGQGEASFLFTDTDAAWNWAEPLGPDCGGSMADCYQSSMWSHPLGRADISEVSVHEYESETTPEAWVMLQCVCPMTPAQQGARQ